LNTEEYDRMYRLEESYWWFLGRHDLIKRYLRSTYSSKANLRILDIGCGTGAMSAKLTDLGDVFSADFHPLALSYCRKRNLGRLCAADAMRLPFRGESFDVIVALDVIEHLPDDSLAISEFQRVLKPGGRIVATVPAYPSLWSAHDTALMHYRRYLARPFATLFRNARLRVERLSYTMTALLPVVWLVRRLSRSTKGEPKASLLPVPAAVNRLLVGLLRAENWFVNRCALPCGVTVFCVARRPESAL
jgi:ubiquinone/menaquinone biosynthesis C-methylase UbiE